MMNSLSFSENNNVNNSPSEAKASVCNSYYFRHYVYAARSMRGKRYQFIYYISMGLLNVLILTSLKRHVEEGRALEIVANCLMVV